MKALLHCFVIYLLGFAFFTAQASETDFIVEAEAYIDEGLLHTPVVFDMAVPDLTEMVEQIDITSLPVGVHRIYLRFKNQQGDWSQAMSQSFYITDHNLSSEVNIFDAEAFIDTDPGEGNGIQGFTAVDGNFNQSLEEIIAQIPVSQLNTGIHTIYVRIKNTSEEWSLPISQSFYLTINNNTSNPVIIQDAEAYFDTDPGEGLGISLAVDSGLDVNAIIKDLNGDLALNALSTGLHTIYIRVKSSSGSWSLPISESVYIISQSLGSGYNQIVSADYSINGAAFQSAVAKDGAFDDLIEELDFNVADNSIYPNWRVRFTDIRGNSAISGGSNVITVDDVDHDNLPDSWELTHLGGLGQGANDDPDNDGFSNIQEYLNGTDPLLANSNNLTISGFIFAESGAGLVSKQVCTLISNVETCATTNPLGHYAIGLTTTLPAGTYTVYPKAVSNAHFTPVELIVELTSQSVSGINFIFNPLHLDITAPVISADYYYHSNVILHWFGNAGLAGVVDIYMKRDSVPSNRTEPLPNDPDWYQFNVGAENDGVESLILPTGLNYANDWRFYVAYRNTSIVASSPQPFTLNPLADLVVSNLTLGIDRGLEFDGVDDQVMVVDPEGLDLQHWTIEADLNPFDDVGQTLNEQAIIWKGGVIDTSSINFALIWDGEHFIARFTDTNGMPHQVSSNAVLADQFYHVAASFDGLSLALSIDGVIIDTLYFDPALAPETGLAPIYFAQPAMGVSNVSAFHGVIGDVRLWQVARSESEIARDMIRQLGGSEIGLVGYWTFDDEQAILKDYSTTLNGLFGAVNTQPLLVIVPAMGSFATEPGATLNVDWILANIGDAEGLGGFVDRLYLSTDAVVGGDITTVDVPLAEIDIPHIGIPIERNAALQIPSNLSSGDYFLLVKTDIQDDWLEVNEDNNLKTLPLYVRSLPSVDLTIENIQIPVTAQPNETIQIQWTTTNLGSGLAVAPWRETVILSVDGTIGNSQVVAELVVEDDLAAGESVARTFSFTLPNILNLSGAVQVGLSADRNQILNDADRQNNTVFAAADIDIAQLLFLHISASSVAEDGNPVSVTLTRSNAVANEDLTVLLESSDISGLEVPAEVVIPAGQNRVNFNVSPVDDGRPNGNRTLTITASALNYETATDSLIVRESGIIAGNVADLLISNITIPTLAETESRIQIGFRMENQGDVTAVGANANDAIGFAGSWQQRIYLSEDNQIGDDTLVATAEFTATLAASAATNLSMPIRMPIKAGNYWVVVRTDFTGRVLESDEFNNATISPTPIQVDFAYSAQVETALETGVSGDIVPLTGQATTLAGQPAVSVLVNIEIHLGETKRIISALTNSVGQFNATFTPLQGEAGNYNIGAGHPGQTDYPIQDSFALQGFNAVATDNPLAILEGETIDTIIRLTNQTNIVLTNLNVSVGQSPVNVQVTVIPNNNPLNGLGVLDIQVTVQANTAAESGQIEYTITTNEGVTHTLILPVQVTPLGARLTLDSTKLTAGMPLGEQRNIIFHVTNEGNNPSGDINIQMTNYPWLTVATPHPMPSLGAGETAELVLTLAPATDLPLGLYTGSLQLAGTDNSVQIPFEFRAVSDGQGDLEIEVVDEYFYFDDAEPRVTGAEVKVYDQFTGVLLAEAVTGNNGLAIFPNLANDYYRVVISADKHENAEQQLLVEAGQNNQRRVFISRNAVTYEWNVTEVGLEDLYEITIESLFETNVPIPVIVYDPPRIDLSPLTGAGQSMQVDLKVSNHGLIAAQHFRLQLDNVPGYRITPLVTGLDELAAMSTVTIPLLIERLDVSPDNQLLNKLINKKSGVAADAGSCSRTGIVGIYDYICGPNMVTKSNSIEVGDYSAPTSALSCGASGGGSYTTVHYGTGGGTGGGSGGCCGGGGGGYSGGRVSQTSCDECLEPLFKTILECAVGAVPLIRTANCVRNAATCISGVSSGLSGGAAVGCAAGAASCAGHSLPVVGTLLCLGGLSDTISGSCSGGDFGGGGGPSGRSADKLMAHIFTKSKNVQADNSFVPPIALGVESSTNSALDSYTWLAVIFGDDLWISADVLPELAGFLEAFSTVTDMSGDQAEWISETETTQLLVPQLPATVSSEALALFVARWNRTQIYWNAGVINRADLPVGDDPDFMGQDELTAAIDKAVAALDATEAKGYSDPGQWLAAELDLLLNKDLENEGVCAVVRLQLSQNLVLTRQGFEASLELKNGSDKTLSNISIDIRVVDANGIEVNDRFGITAPLLMNFDTVDGTGELLASSTGTARWTLAPNDEAAPNGVTDYFVSGILSYIDNGFNVSINLLPVRIAVRPNASLIVDYFHQRDVYSDDPFTEIIEPSIPYALGVLVRNDGAGEATNLHIDSGEPEIIDNEKGLLIDFDIIASQVGGQNITPSLSLELGDIAGHSVKVGQWLFTSSLQGHFRGYRATFTHVDPLGILSSLVKDVQIHEMLRPVNQLGVQDDGLPDFLTNDDRDDAGMPDILYLSDGTTEPVSLANGTITWDSLPTANNLSVGIQVDMGAGNRYLRTPDLGNGLRLISAVRSDGRVLPIDRNIWQTNRTFPGVQQTPIRENMLHLFDKDSDGQYNLTYAAAVDASFSIQAIANQSVNEGANLNLQAAVIDIDLNNVSFSLQNPPAGALIDPNTGVFNWMPNENQGGIVHSITLIATERADPTNTTSEIFLVTVSEVNQAPVFAAIPDETLIAGEIIDLTVVATDADIPANNLTYSLGAGAPTGVSINPATGLLHWQTSVQNVGEHDLTIQVTDNGIPALSNQIVYHVSITETDSAYAALFYGTNCDDVGDCQLLALDHQGHVTTVGNLSTEITCHSGTGDINITPTMMNALSFDSFGRLWSVGTMNNQRYLLRVNPADANITDCQEMLLDDNLVIGDITGLASAEADGSLLAVENNNSNIELIHFNPMNMHVISRTAQPDGAISAISAKQNAGSLHYGILDHNQLVSFNCLASDCTNDNSLNQTIINDFFNNQGTYNALYGLNMGLAGDLYSVDNGLNQLLKVNHTGFVSQNIPLINTNTINIQGLAESLSYLAVTGTSTGGILQLRVSSIVDAANNSCIDIDVDTPAGATAEQIAEQIATAMNASSALSDLGIVANNIQANLQLNAAITQVNTNNSSIGIVLNNAVLLSTDNYPANCAMDTATGDINNDDTVNLHDLNIMRGHFGEQAVGNNDPFDINHDGVINVLDFRLLINACSNPRCAIQ